jgi:chromosome segregation ATPase
MMKTTTEYRAAIASWEVDKQRSREIIADAEKSIAAGLLARETGMSPDDRSLEDVEKDIEAAEECIKTHKRWIQDADITIEGLQKLLDEAATAEEDAAKAEALGKADGVLKLIRDEIPKLERALKQLDKSVTEIRALRRQCHSALLAAGFNPPQPSNHRLRRDLTAALQAVAPETCRILELGDATVRGWDFRQSLVAGLDPHKQSHPTVMA